MDRAAPPVLLTLGIAFALPRPIEAAPRMGPEAFRRVLAFLERQEVKPGAPRPAWYRPDRAPIFTFVQISDIHLDRRVEPILREALAFCRKHIRPTFIAVTGDNAGGSTVERQRHLKEVLEREASGSTFVLRGDNWARNFAAVFGSTQWSFDCGGVHFIGNGLDRDVEGRGIGIFAEDTWRWLREEIEAHRDRPIVYFQHETIQPPVFLDAGRLHELLEAAPNVLLVMAGHVHLDLESKIGRVVHITCPGLGPHRLHGFKVAHVYPEGIVIRTAVRAPLGYRWAETLQAATIPPALRAPVRGPVRIENIRRRPVRETIFDAALAKRENELIPGFLVYAQRIGQLQGLLRAIAGKSERKEKP